MAVLLVYSAIRGQVNRILIYRVVVGEILFCLVPNLSRAQSIS